MIELQHIKAAGTGMDTMGIQRKPSRKRGNTARTLVADIPELHIAKIPEVKNATVSSDLDQFKFKMVEREGKHYFQNVRYNTHAVPAATREQVIQFFDGRCLESITPTLLKSKLKSVEALPMFEQLVSGLRQIFVD